MTSKQNGSIKCIQCALVCHTDDCVGQMHSCENNKPFPEEEAFKCIQPKENQFIKLGIIEECRQSCGKNEVSTGCHCKVDRKCVCPKYTHYEDSTGDCWKCSSCLENTKLVGQHKCLDQPLHVVIIF